jgi:ABC-type multidrug transport system ATPase subunit
MTALLSLHSVGFRLNGERVLSGISLEAGAGMLALLGSGGAGKTTLLELIAGGRKPTDGNIVRAEHLWLVPEAPGPLAASPLKRIRRSLRRRSGPASEAGHLLEVYGLWDARERDGRELGRSHSVAAAVAEGHAARPSVLLLDCCLDAFPPHICARVVQELHRLGRSGTCVVFATRRAEVAELAPRVCVLEHGALVADGSPQSLVAGIEGEELVVETDDPRGVRSLVDPWAIAVRETPQGLRITAPPGQERVVELLRAGYGNVRAVVTRRATLADAWERLRR